jgi:MFS family permease
MKSDSQSRALRFIVLLGLVSLLADVVYEGGRGIIGPYLSTLGATGAAVGLIVGLGELAGYSLRLGSGYLSDKTRSYWKLTIIGYLINLLAIPCIALTSRWQMVALLVVIERLGKALRVPARDAMLSYATAHTGRGWGFGLHEALDQIGAVIGPILMILIVAAYASYRAAFAWLLLPALICIAFLIATRLRYPTPEAMEPPIDQGQPTQFSKPFRLLILAVGLWAAGFVAFPLVAYRLQAESILSPRWIPAMYAIAMGADGVMALLAGRLFDRYGTTILIIAVLAAIPAAPMLFYGHWAFLIVGVILWGAGMGAQESILRASVASLAPPGRRGRAFGYLNAVLGLAGFLGSVAMGALYDISSLYLVLLAITLQLGAFFCFLAIRR